MIGEEDMCGNQEMKNGSFDFDLDSSTRDIETPGKTTLLLLGEWGNVQFNLGGGCFFSSNMGTMQSKNTTLPRRIRDASTQWHFRSAGSNDPGSVGSDNASAGVGTGEDSFNLGLSDMSCRNIGGNGMLT